MSADLEIRNGKASMAYVGATPWHGLGTPADDSDLYDWPAFCGKAGLDTEAELVPLQLVDDGQLSTYRAVRRTCDGVILANVVGPDYHILQNRKAFAWFQPFLETKAAALHTAGALRNGSRVWVQAKLNQDNSVILKGDEIEKFILLSHSHDGSLAVRVGFTPVRVVCQNTMTMAHGDKASKLIRVKHTKGMQVSLDAIRDVMNLANQEFEATAEQYRFLAGRQISQADLTAYVRKVFGVEPKEEVSSRLANIMAEVVRLSQEGKGSNIPGVQGTYWGAYNGLSEYLTWERGNKPEGRLDSLWFGSGAGLNRLALETALEMAS